MYKKEIEVGTKFGEWTVIEATEKRKHGHLVYKVKCSCGIEAEHMGYYLRALKSPFCRSCSAKLRTPKNNNNKFYKHGATMPGNPARNTYKVWVTMRQRCIDINSRDYKNYGGRGISVCDRWNTFENFLQDMGICPKGLSLERINNNGNYNKENCQWVTRKVQNNNRRDNTFFMIDGIRVTRTQIQDKLKWTRDMYRRRSEKYGLDWIVEQYRNAHK